MMNRVIFLVISITTVMIALSSSNLNSVSGFPRSHGSSISESSNSSLHHRSKRSSDEDRCHSDFTFRLLCERCAKYTKSTLAYTLCCDKSDTEVHKWCKSFLEYDIGASK